MPCGGMPDLMPQNSRHFGFAVAQGDKLTGDVDIATGQGESVVHGRIEQRYIKIALRIAEPRLHRNIFPDAHNIFRLRTLHRPAKFL